MKYTDMMGEVGQRAGIPTGQVDGAVKATLQALAEQADPAQFGDLAEQLPKEIKQATQSPPTPQYRSLPEFFSRVAELSEMPGEQARAAARAVVGVIAEEINYDQIEDIFGRLPSQFLDLVPTRTPRLTAREFFDRVRGKADLRDQEEAVVAVRATLAALAERITGGQAQDIALYLPQQARKYLATAREQAAAFDRNRFIERIAEIGQTDAQTATRYAAAVFATLTDVVPAPEIRDTIDQLPPGILRMMREPMHQR